MNSKLAKQIREVFRVSEIITANGEKITPIYKFRENLERDSIKEDELKEFLYKYIPSEYQFCIPIIIQKTYHPTKEDEQKDETLRLLSLG